MCNSRPFVGRDKLDALVTTVAIDGDAALTVDRSK